MNTGEQVNDKLLFINMTLQARLGIRDFFLKNTVREIYENIGQVLSVVRMQLAVLDSSPEKAETDDRTHSPGHLVGQSIRDLRAMCKSFYPDADIMKDGGFTEAFENSIEILFQNTKPAIKIKGEIKDIQPELKLIVFKMILEILTALKEIEAKYVGFIVSYKKQEVELTVSYRGKELVAATDATASGLDGKLTLQQRAQLIGAKFNVTESKVGTRRIKLTSPLKSIL